MVSTLKNGGHLRCSKKWDQDGTGTTLTIQRKGQRNKPLSECQQRRNKRIARTRARVEHVFGAIDQMGGKLLRTIGQARANFAMTMMAACYNLKRLVYFQKAGIKAF